MIINKRDKLMYDNMVFNKNEKMIIFASSNQEILNLNQISCNILGFSKKILLNKLLKDLIYIDDINIFEKQWIRLLINKSDMCFDSRLMNHKKQAINVQINFQCDFDEFNNIEQVIIMMSLINQHKSQFRFADTLDYVVVSIWSDRTKVEEMIIYILNEAKKNYPSLSCCVALLNENKTQFSQIISIENFEYYQFYLNILEINPDEIPYIQATNNVEMIEDIESHYFRFDNHYQILTNSQKIKSSCILPLCATDKLFYGKLIINHNHSHSELIENIESLKSVAKLISLTIEYAYWQEYYYEMEEVYKSLNK